MDQCDEFDRLEAVSTEAAKRIRTVLELIESPSVRSDAFDYAVKDLWDIVQRIEERRWPS